MNYITKTSIEKFTPANNVLKLFTALFPNKSRMDDTGYICPFVFVWGFFFLSMFVFFPLSLGTLQPDLGLNVLGSSLLEQYLTVLKVLLIVNSTSCFA